MILHSILSDPRSRKKRKDVTFLKLLTMNKKSLRARGQNRSASAWVEKDDRSTTEKTDESKKKKKAKGQTNRKQVEQKSVNSTLQI